jgi:hypothetical protein
MYGLRPSFVARLGFVDLAEGEVIAKGVVNKKEKKAKEVEKKRKEALEAKKLNRWNQIDWRRKVLEEERANRRMRW